MKRGLLISIEGCEGAGKSTAVRFVEDYLKRLSVDHIITREPGGTEIAEEIRNLLLHHHDEVMATETEALLMFASRAQHIKHKILPALQEGKWVITDRFTDASYAYQGGGRELGIEKIDQLKQWVLGDFEPDMTVLLDLSVELSASRLKRRAKLDRIEVEKQDFFERIREMYLALAHRDKKRFQVIDASKSLQEVQSDLTLIISSAFSQWQGEE
jgi:dTMP kinase